MSAPDPNLDPNIDRRYLAPRSSSAAWWVAGIVAVIAIVAVAYTARQPATQPTNDQIAAAAAQGYVQGAQTAQAQDSAAMQSSAAAQQSLADQAAQSRADAQAAAERANRSNGDQTGRDVPAPQSDNGG
jgi:hypothetical protein